MSDGRLRELALLFLRLGTTAFGGPAAHIAMMEDEVVRRRKWVTREEFLDLLGATNLIPGPNSTELAIHLGNRRAGFPGLLVAGSCFILPAALIVGVIGWVYVRFGNLPQADALLYGIKPVILAVVVQALWGLGKTALKNWPLRVLGAAAVVAAALGVNELVVLLGAGVLSATAQAASAKAVPAPPKLDLPVSLGLFAAAGAAATPFQLSTLFGVFVKVGSVLFGSGYVLLAFLRSDLVERLGWLTEAQLLDAVAVGQVTPGPVFTTATFIGYLLGGASGAVVATVGIFLPAFFFVALSARLVPALRRSPRTGAVLDGVNVASLALMAWVTWQLGGAAILDWPTAALALLSAVLLLRFRLNSAWLVLGGALAGIVLKTGYV